MDFGNTQKYSLCILVSFLLMFILCFFLILLRSQFKRINSALLLVLYIVYGDKLNQKCIVIYILSKSQAQEAEYSLKTPFWSSCHRLQLYNSVGKLSDFQNQSPQRWFTLQDSNFCGLVRYEKRSFSQLKLFITTNEFNIRFTFIQKRREL